MSEKNLSAAAARNGERIAALEREVGVNLSDCYQCGKCTAGCPMAQSMDLMPRQVIRCLQLGLLDEALESRAPWICAECNTCSTRCPHDVPIAELMEGVRQAASRQGIHPVRTARIFTEDFMKPIKWFGKNHEFTFTAFYNLRSGRVFQHFPYLPKMLAGGKLRILPEGVRDKKAVRKIIKNCEREVAGK